METDSILQDAGAACQQQACSPTALDGYKAASILIERMLNSAEKKKPLRLRRVKQKSADYRQGVYDAILTAHCWMVLGEYPDHNREQIAEALKSANAVALPLAGRNRHPNHERHTTNHIIMVG